MEPELSMFETSEMVANLLASTTLLHDTWRLSSTADSGGINVDQIGPIGLMGFSLGQGHGPMFGLEMSQMVPLAGNGVFSGLDRPEEDDDGPVLVHGGFFEIFLGLYRSPSFENKMKSLLERSRAIILTGHSIGGAIASLTTIWLLCYLQSISSPLQVLCITFGSPLLGNDSLSKWLLRQRWASNFCHVVLQSDIVPRLLFAPLHSLNTQLWSTNSNEVKNELYRFVLGHTEAIVAKLESSGDVAGSFKSFWPFGNHFLCSEDGAICVDNVVSVVKLMHLMLGKGNSSSCFEDHNKYGGYVERMYFQSLIRREFRQGNVCTSTYDAGLALALESSGFARQESVYEQAKDCLKTEKQMGLTPNLNSAKLAIRLSKITPLRAQIEWYKSSCDESENQMGYYDSFKHRQASKRDNQVNMFRIRLASFWDSVITMIDNNELPPDIYKRRKWVHASHFYQLLVEPLDIAEYYRSGEHFRMGHYLKNGRERRHELIDKWWRERYFVEETRKRSRFASLTQDSCFWARVEEARELLKQVRTERDLNKLKELWDGIDRFERYSSELIENKEVSVDVIAKNSSYSLWVAELRELRLQMQMVSFKCT